MEVCGDLHAPRPPFNPVLILRLQHLLQRLLSSSGSSSSSSSEARASLTRWLCGKSDDPGAFSRGAPRLLQQCSALLQQHVHPVLLLLYRRRLLGGGPLGVPREPEGDQWAPPGAPLKSKGVSYEEGLVQRPGGDGCNLALAIEGGAMRGCVSAGMAVCLDYLGFRESVDTIYGSSAGAMIGAFLVSKQLAYEGTCIYTDWLPHLGKEFIDVKRIGRALGLGCLLDWDLKDLFRSRLGRPLVNLDALLVDVLQNKQPLNWSEFERNDRRQPLKIISSGLLSMRSVTLESASGNLRDLASLAECLRASMLLPGMSGPVVHLPLWGPPPEASSTETASGSFSLLGAPGSSVSSSSRGPLPQVLPLVSSSALPRFAAEAPKALVTEPLADALLFEPIPYRSAIRDGATHVLVFRTRPDTAMVGRLRGLEAAMEMQMARRFFLRKHDLRLVYEHMARKAHRQIYMRDMLRLNAATNNLNKQINAAATSQPHQSSQAHAGPAQRQAHALAVAIEGAEKETQKLKADRLSIIRGVRGGFAALWEALQPEPSLRGRGREEAERPPPAYTLERPFENLSLAELAEYFTQAAAAVAAQQGPTPHAEVPNP